MKLSEVFTEIAYKELAQVDLPDQGSNQHELNGSASLRAFFNTSEKISLPVSWHYFSDDQDPLQETGHFTFYDARAKSSDRTGRTEWRGYYTGRFLSNADAGDALILARTDTGELYGLVFQKGSGWLRSAKVLFGLEAAALKFQIVREEALSQQKLEFTEQLILEELGFALNPILQPSDEELMIKNFGMVMPGTKILSEFARTQIEVDVIRPDETLIRWIERETQLFFALEKVFVQQQLNNGFESVEHFLRYSLSVQQSRKSRMGHSLQNQLEALFLAHKLRFTPQSKTEGKNKPDFVFPGQSEYHDPNFDATLLIMLGVKSTAKDRWRQILTEADKILDKHLCTLETGISSDQTDEMKRKRLTLVIPEALFPTYSALQQNDILNLNHFIELVKEKQS